MKNHKSKVDIIASYIDVLTKTKFDANFPDRHFKMSGYEFPPRRRYRNPKGGGK